MRNDKFAARILVIGAVFFSLVLAGCGAETVGPSPTVSLLPTPIPTPILSPTATLLPPVPITIHWPTSVSALEDIPVQVDLPGLLERDPDAQVLAFVSDPALEIVWVENLEPVGDGSFAGAAPVHLPLGLESGEWRIRVHVESTVRLSGEPAVSFYPEPVPLWDLEGRVPSGVVLHIPRDFVVVRTEGDLVSGRWAWEGSGGEVALWWTPGPTEPLTQDLAQMMLAVTLPSNWPVDVTSLEFSEWRGLPALLATEHWPQGPAETVMVQGPNHWLYLLRVRSLDEAPIAALLYEIRETFQVEEE